MNGNKAVRAGHRVSILAALLLYVCLGLAEAPISVSAAQVEHTQVERTKAGSAPGDVDIASILAYFGRLQTLSVAEIGQEKRRIEAHVANGTATVGDLLRLVLVQSRQDAASRETKETATLLREHLRHARLNAEQRHFADLLMLFVQDRESCRELVRKTRYQARVLQRKLDELTTIETNISHREGSLNPSAP